MRGPLPFADPPVGDYYILRHPDPAEIAAAGGAVDFDQLATRRGEALEGGALIGGGLTTDDSVPCWLHTNIDFSSDG